MITIYDVIDNTDPESLATYVDRERADRHAAHARQFCRNDETVTVNPRQVDRLSRQPVFIPGAVICFQFSRTTNGARTMRLTIRDLAQADDGTITGTVKTMGRLVVVELREHIPEARIDSAARFCGWLAIREIRA